MRTVLGAVYGALIVLVIAIVLDLIVAGSLLGPDGTIPAWYGSVRYVAVAVLICLGLVWGAWRARRRQGNTGE